MFRQEIILGRRPTAVSLEKRMMGQTEKSSRAFECGTDAHTRWDHMQMWMYIREEERLVRSALLL